MEVDICKCGFMVGAHNANDRAHCGISDGQYALTREERDEIQQAPFTTMVALSRYEATVRDLEALVRRLESDLVRAVKHNDTAHALGYREGHRKAMADAQAIVDMQRGRD